MQLRILKHSFFSCCQPQRSNFANDFLLQSDDFRFAFGHLLVVCGLLSQQPRFDSFCDKIIVAMVTPKTIASFSFSFH